MKAGEKQIIEAENSDLFDVLAYVRELMRQAGYDVISIRLLVYVDTVLRNDGLARMLG